MRRGGWIFKIFFVPLWVGGRKTTLFLNAPGVYEDVILSRGSLFDTLDCCPCYKV